MLEFQSRMLKFKFDGIDHEIRFPNVVELRNFSTSYDKEDSDKVQMIFDLIVSLGMNKEECEKLEMSMLNDILMELTKEKK
jgi:hypothetical protein|tara:strand:- start:466 stop:708 length:243 start_codon:yes stop_codon:yes gene_type:complete